MSCLYHTYESLLFLARSWSKFSAPSLRKDKCLGTTSHSSFALIKTDNFECSHLRGTSLNITDIITTKYCKRGAFLRAHNTFRVSYSLKTLVLLRVAHGKIFQRAAHFCLPSKRRSMCKKLSMSRPVRTLNSGIYYSKVCR